MKSNIVFSLLGTVKDFVGKRQDRWGRWRPNISLCHHQDFKVAQLELLHYTTSQRLANKIIEDIHQISPQTNVNEHIIAFDDPWDLQEVYTKLYDICVNYQFDTEKHQYYFHITTGTHIAQIVIFLLAESRIFPGKLIQTSPSRGENKAIGSYQVIDLDLAKYDAVASRFLQRKLQGEAFLKNGIQTRNPQFNAMIEQIEKVAIRSKAPILLTGPTGAGKSQLAHKVFELKKQRRQVNGDFVSVNCATLRGDNAMSALFGHIKGAFTGAAQSRDGFLRKADTGILFLDEIGELGLDEQAMLLHALESKTFYPVGSDKTVSADFQLIAGTNKDLKQEVITGRFREDLLARINLWSYELPGLAARKEDIEPNIEYELNKLRVESSKTSSFNKEAFNQFINFATSHEALWLGNFRDLNAAIVRMSTLADGARIHKKQVDEEIQRLKAAWQNHSPTQLRFLEQSLNEEEIAQLDLFDRLQLNSVLEVCRRHDNMASAGRELFQASRQNQASRNDSQRLQKYLAKFGLKWSHICSLL